MDPELGSQLAPWLSEQRPQRRHIITGLVMLITGRVLPMRRGITTGLHHMLIMVSRFIMSRDIIAGDHTLTGEKKAGEKGPVSLSYGPLWFPP